MNQTAIGSYISRKHREKNLTQEQLAEKLGVSNKTISKWEKRQVHARLQHYWTGLQGAFRYAFRADERRGCGGGQHAGL